MNIPSIEIYSREEFDKFISNNGINNNICYIGIISSNDDYTEYPLFKYKYKFGNNIIMMFDDIDLFGLEKMFPENGPYNSVFNKFQASHLFDFILKNINKSKFIIHCDAGISRSTSVGLFISKMFDYINYFKNMSITFKDIPIKLSCYVKFLNQYAFRKHPNKMVVKLLTEQFNIYFETDLDKYFEL